MQVDISGEWLYVHSGHLSHIEEQDIYMFVNAIRLTDISAIDVNYQTFSIKLHVHGLEPFFYITFQTNRHMFKPKLRELVEVLRMNPAQFNLE
jgi:hypothetical protein